VTPPTEPGGGSPDLLKDVVRLLGKVVIALFTVLAVLITVVAGVCFFAS
jgi:hypothetical protein